MVSAGLVMYRFNKGALEIFLGHPGGPFFAKKDEGVWSIPKGEVGADEDLLQTAAREFEEETGIKPEGEHVSLGHIRQKNGKLCMPGHLKATGITPTRYGAIRLP